MAAEQVYQWGYIAPDGNAGVYMHGFPDDWAVVFSAIVYALEGQAYIPLGSINLTQGAVARHVDDTIARAALVHNLAPFNPCAVRLSILWDTYTLTFTP